MPNPIPETRVLKLVLITILCLKFWVLMTKLKTGYPHETQYRKPGFHK